MNRFTITAIAAMAKNRVIGADNKIPWHIPEDFKYFKKHTLNKPLIMGRKTFESIMAITGKPLPKRTSIVLTRGDYQHEGVLVAHTPEQALELANQDAEARAADEIIIAGGAEIYSLFLSQTDRILLTIIDMETEGDAHFPELGAEWQEVWREDHEGFAFTEWKRS